MAGEHLPNSASFFFFLSDLRLWVNEPFGAAV